MESVVIYLNEGDCVVSCEMCGKQGEIFLAEVEGTTLNVCGRCAQFGRVIKRAPAPRPVIAGQKATKTEELKKELP